MRPITTYTRYAAFTQALIATCGSLYLSEIMRLPPCVLCWYQRICMYPMIIILGVGILRGDRKLYQYALPLAAIGWFVALYHSLIQWHVVSDYIPACQIGVSCTTVQINLLGFITIPFMSLCAFSVIIIAMFIERGTTK